MPPQGKQNNVSTINFEELIQSVMENDDDQFFHLTCHVDGVLQEKIENGEFVDLEKLIPKTRNQVLGVGNDEQHMQLVTKGRLSYWVPADRDCKITNVHKWEQAFRIYAAIYCKAKPHRASEIWQYIYVINSVAAAYT